MASLNKLRIMDLTKEQLEILNSTGHLLVKGGPGSGKTTVSILKAAAIAEQGLKPGQRILFLSFARATVSRVVEAIESEQAISREIKAKIEVETYHSFFWTILKTHGYLIGLPRRLELLSPSGEAIALSGTRSAFPSRGLTDEQKEEKAAAEDVERRKLAFERGSICFALFAEFVADLVQRSERIRILIANKYPVIILDEFQDTDAEQWRVVKSLGKCIRIISLADPEQRIFEWIGADPERLDHFVDEFAPTLVDLGATNHRSKGTDLATFGDHILTGNFRDEDYVGLDIQTYPSNENQACTKLITTTLAVRKRLVATKKPGWSVAILVPTKAMTRLVSDKLRTPPAGLVSIPHSAAIEMEAVILAAELIAYSLEFSGGTGSFEKFVSMLEEFFLGRGGDSPTKKDIGIAARLSKDRESLKDAFQKGKKPRKTNSAIPIQSVFDSLCTIKLSGNPDADWLEVRRQLEDSGSVHLKEVCEEARNIRMLDRGTDLRQALAQIWRDHGSYKGALESVRSAFVQDHFSTALRPEQGVVVMNMHKAKGKQFDEVIIFDGWERYRNRIVRQNDKTNITGQVRQNFRVSVTRAKSRTTILTPERDPCVLLV